jgi:hypothetical protein
MAKIVCVLYDDPVDGYPRSYARDSIPKIESYPGGQTAPTPKAIDFTPGSLLGSVSGGPANADSGGEAPSCRAMGTPPVTNLTER